MIKNFENFLQKAEKIQTRIITLLIDVNHGHLNTNLIRPSKLEEEIGKIKQHLNGRFLVPGESRETIMQTI